MTSFRHVFVLCTGRSGSVSLSRACGQVTNYTVGHESRSAIVGGSHFAYPPGHIEIDNRLAWFLGRLERWYGTEPLYVHLRRDPEATARSFARRGSRGIMRAYRQGLHLSRPDVPMIDLARDYCQTVTDNISAFLKDKPHTHELQLERIADQFPVLWDRLGATGDFDAAMQILAIRHNASPPHRPTPAARWRERLEQLWPSGRLPDTRDEPRAA